MKFSRFCVAFFVMVVSVAAFGDSITDPKIIIRGVSGTSSPLVGCPASGCKDVGLHFSFSVPKGGEGSLFFTNASGQNWTSLKLIETGELASDISCKAVVFLNCTVTTLKNGSVEILFSGVKGTLNPQVGILNGQSFAIDLLCVKGDCWKQVNFTAGANGTLPEPGTMALIVTGLGAIVSRRKQWKNRVF